MSAAVNAALADAASIAPSTPRQNPTRRLWIVAPPEVRRRPRVAYGIIAVAGAVAIGAAQMLLSIVTTQSSYELSSLKAEQRSLTLEKQALYDSVAGLSSPQYLAANASALGMVINESPSYLRLSDGALLGAGNPAVWNSTIDALNRGSVANSLIKTTPLVTAPDATIQGVPAPVVAPDATLPPPITEGIPTPQTR